MREGTNTAGEPAHEAGACPSCDRFVPKDAPHGLCPHCLAQSAFVSHHWTEAEAEPAFALSFGRYELLGERGRGATGAVFRARDTRTGEIVALKILLQGRFASVKQRERFAREAEAIGRLHHPGIVTLKEVGECEGQPFLAMEWIDSQTLDDLARRKPILPSEAARLVRDLAQAVHHAHEMGIIHRDLHPANVLIDNSGRPLVADFGLSRASQGDTEITHTGDALGTPGFMPPEQARMEPEQFTPASDIYSLGAVLYFLLTGRPPFMAPSYHETVLEVLHGEPVLPTRLNFRVPPALEAVCLQCMEKNPQRRYATAQELANDLDRYLRSERVHARPVSRWRIAWRWCRRRPLLAALWIGLILSLGVGIAGVSWQWRLATEALRVTAAANTAAQEAKGRLLESVSRLRMERVEEMLGEDQTASALTLLGLELRASPSNRVATERTLSLLDRRTFFLPKAARLALGDKVNNTTFSARGDLVGVAGYDGVARVLNLGLRQPVGLPIRSSNAFYSVALSPDGSRAAAGTTAGEVHIWDVATGREMSAVLRHPGNAVGLSFSPDGSRLLVAWSGYDTAKKDIYGMDLWEIDTGRRVFPTLRSNSYIWRGVFSRDGRRVVAVSTARVLEIRDSETGHAILPPLGTEGGVHQVAFSSDGNRLAAADYGGCVRAWNALTGEKLGEIRHAKSAVWVEFSSDADRFVTASEDHTAVVFNLRTGKSLGAPMRHNGVVWCARYSPDSAQIATAAADGTVQYWDAESGRPIGEPLRHETPVLQAQFTEQGRALITVTKDHHIHRWETPSSVFRRPDPRFEVEPPVIAVGVDNTGARRIAVTATNRLQILDGRGATVRTLLERWPHRLVAAWFSPNGRHALTRDSENQVELWSGETARPLGEPIGMGNDALPPIFSPDGARFVVMLNDTTLRAFESETGQPAGPPLPFLEGHLIHSRAFSPDGNRLAVGYYHGETFVWNLAKGTFDRCPAALLSHDLSTAFSPDGTLIAGGSTTGEVVVWQATNPTVQAGPFPHPQTIRKVSFAPEGKTLLTIAADNGARLWDYRKGVLKTPVLPHPGELTYDEFSPDGKRLLTLVGDRTLFIWDTSTGRALVDSLEVPAAVLMVHFDPSGDRVVVVARSGWVRVCDSATGLPVNDLARQATPLTAADMSQNRQWLVTADQTGNVALTEFRAASGPAPEWLAELAEALAGRRRLEDGTIQIVSTEALWELRQRLASIPGTGFSATWARDFSATPKPRAGRPSLP